MDDVELLKDDWLNRSWNEINLKLNIFETQC